MAEYFTWAQLRDKVLKDLALEGESFIEEDELLGYCNEAINDAEAEIHGLYEDYFLNKSQVALVSGTAQYDLPTDIYAMKIRGIVYRNGAVVYKVNRMRDWHKFEEYELDQVNGSGLVYSYMILNATAGAPKITLTPTPSESGNYLNVYYLRNANRLATDDDICDIPEFSNYIMQYMKVRCYEKEVGHPMLPKAIADLERERQQMVSTLASLAPDLDNMIEPDISLYVEMS